MLDLVEEVQKCSTLVPQNILLQENRNNFVKILQILKILKDSVLRYSQNPQAAEKTTDLDIRAGIPSRILELLLFENWCRITDVVETPYPVTR